MTMESWKCPTCDKIFDRDLKVSHIPQCYRNYCKNTLHIIPLCTCNTCRGIKSHDGDSEDGQSSPKRPRVMQSAYLSPPISPKGSQTVLDDSQNIGQNCLVCGQHKSPANITIPKIHIGKYHKYMICKKSHLTERNFVLNNGELSLLTSSNIIFNMFTAFT